MDVRSEVWEELKEDKWWKNVFNVVESKCGG